PESLFVLPVTMVLVAAFAAILGMHLSLRCRTTVWAVMSSVGIVMGAVFGLTACGQGLLNMSGQSHDVGLALGSFSPFTLMSLQIDPYRWGNEAFVAAEAANSGYRRVMIFIFGYLAAGGYALVVWWMYKSMVRNFDMTIRRQ